MRQPVAYIRRSVASRGNPGDLSREFQVDEVRRLAGPDAANLRIFDGDWGKSAATDKTDKRLAFLEMLDAIERGEVSTLIAYSTDRLARSVQWASRLLDACERADTTIVTGEGRFAPGDDGARVTFQVLGVMNENALRGMTKKNNATVEARKARNVAAGRKPTAGMGRKGYGKDPARPDEDRSAVIIAFEEAGSFLGACKLLNERGVPTRLATVSRNGSVKPVQWSMRTVARIVREDAHRLLPLTTRRGQRVRAQRLLAGLLSCHCGDLLTTMPRAGSVGYYCRRAHANPSHPRPYVVSENKLLPYIQAEAAKLITEPAVQMAETAQAERDALDARRGRLVDQYEMGDIGRDDYRARLGKIDAELEALDIAERVEDVPAAIPWDASTETLNALLRTIWTRIELGPDLLPVRFVWTLDRLRAND